MHPWMTNCPCRMTEFTLCFLLSFFGLVPLLRPLFFRCYAGSGMFKSFSGSCLYTFFFFEKIASYLEHSLLFSTTLYLWLGANVLSLRWVCCKYVRMSSLAFLALFLWTWTGWNFFLSRSHSKLYTQLPRRLSFDILWIFSWMDPFRNFEVYSALPAPAPPPHSNFLNQPGSPSYEALFDSVIDKPYFIWISLPVNYLQH